MEPGSDIDMMLRVKSGEIVKLSILFEKYQKQLFAYFYRLTTDTQSSEDLVQNVFMRILQYRKRFSGYGSFQAWMYRIAHHVFLDHVGKNKRYRQNQSIDDMEVRDEHSNLAGQLEHKEQLQLLERALGLLTPEQREILVMSKYQQLKYKEIADILKISEGNVKVRVFRALDSLKEIYTQLEVGTYERK